MYWWARRTRRRARLFAGQGEGRFRGALRNRTSRPLPLSVGDAEPGDVDGDGDLDLVLADWGAGNNMSNGGGRTRVWLNDGSGPLHRCDRQRRMPASYWCGSPGTSSWSTSTTTLDLDVLVSCKRCGGSGQLFRNDGTGHLRRRSGAGLPQYTNNYEFEADGPRRGRLPRPGDDQRRRDRRRQQRLEPPGARLSATMATGSVSAMSTDGLVAGRGEHRRRRQHGRLPRLRLRWGRGLRDRLAERTRPAARERRDRAVSASVLDGLRRERTLRARSGLALGDLDGDGRLDVVQAQGEAPDARFRSGSHLGRGLAPRHGGAGGRAPLGSTPESRRRLAGSRPVCTTARARALRHGVAAWWRSRSRWRSGPARTGRHGVVRGVPLVARLSFPPRQSGIHRGVRRPTPPGTPGCAST